MRIELTGFYEETKFSDLSTPLPHLVVVNRDTGREVRIPVTDAPFLEKLITFVAEETSSSVPAGQEYELGEYATHHRPDVPQGATVFPTEPVPKFATPAPAPVEVDFELADDPGEYQL